MTSQDEGSSTPSTDPPEQPAHWWDRLASAAPVVVSSIGVAASSLIAKSVFDDLGKGDEGPHDAGVRGVSVVLLALGLALIVTGPFLLRIRTRITLGKVKSSMVGAEGLAGFASGQQLAKEIKQLQVRYYQIISIGGVPPTDVVKSLNYLYQVRDEAMEGGRNARAARGGGWMIAFLALGAILTAGSYAEITHLTNNAIERRTDRLAVEAKASQAALPVTPSTVVVTKAIASDWECSARTRPGLTVELGPPPSGFAVTSVVHVVLPKVADCLAAYTWVGADQIGAAEDAPDPEPTSKTPTENSTD